MARVEATETESAEGARVRYTGAGTHNVLGYAIVILPMLPIGVVAMALPY